MNYGKRLLELFEAEKNMRDGKRNELDPPLLELNRQAKASWIAFHDEVERQLKDSAKYSQIRGFGAKVPEHALRLAGALSVVADLSVTKINSTFMECGIELARFYLDEALRINHESSEDPALLLAQKLLEWIRLNHQDAFYLAQIYQYGPQVLRDKDSAIKTIGILENHGWIESIGPMKIDGSMRRDVWRLRQIGGDE